jgi:site-specific DNA-methyltransferase (adenine-specific)
VLPELEAGSVDLVLTDPPYGIADAPNTHVDTPNARRGRRVGRVNTWHPASGWDKGLVLPDFPAGQLIGWFGHWRKRADVEAKYGPARCEIVWVKDTHVGPPCPAAMRDERLWVFGPSFTPRRFETTCWEVPIIPTWAHRHHKNEKPVDLIRRALCWLPGDVVLDPFVGSGTTLRAAKDLGRKAIGIEIEERYCEIAAERLRQGVLDLHD